MAASIPGDINHLLVKWSGGDHAALDELTPLVYDELHRVAANLLHRERPNHTLQPTALVHEAYLRLVGQKRTEWQNRAQFFAVAAQLMRRVLVDHARTRHAAKRGGSKCNLSLTHAEALAGQEDVDFLAVHEALNELATFDEQQVRIVELRFFGGLSIEEAAMVLGISHATVERDWKLARAWLGQRLGT
jgi:RNA polymerase sigma factor (TIGR02999 family)